MTRLFLLLLLTLGGQVWASFAVPVTYQIGGRSYQASSPEAAVAMQDFPGLSAAHLGYWSDCNSGRGGTVFGGSGVLSSFSSGSGIVTNTYTRSNCTNSVGNSGGATSANVWPSITSSAQCPANSTLSGSLCTCVSGFVESGASCVDPNVKKCDDKKGGVDLFTGGAVILPGKPYCASSGAAAKCGGKVSGAWALVKDGKKTWTLEVTYDGSTCTPSPTGTNPTTTTNEAPTPCKGQPGVVNGVEVCIPFGPKNPPSETVNDTTIKNPDGSTSTSTSSTSCTGSKCTTTTTTTTTPAGGGPSTTTTTTKDEPKDDFCTKNPKSLMCLESSFSGSCGAAPACSGDAIQCAIVTEQYRRNCQLYEPDTDPNSSVNKALAGNDPGNVDSMKAAAAASPIGVGSFDFNGKGWSRACPQDPMFVLPWAGGREWTLPLSKLCSPLGLAADIAVALTALACALFVLRVPQG